VAVFAPAIEILLFFRQMGQNTIGKFGLCWGIDKAHRTFVQISHGGLSLDAQIASAQQFKNPVTDVGKTQAGNGLYLVFRQLGAQIVFHTYSSFNPFSLWYQIFRLLSMACRWTEYPFT
jgi:hypothetical protein